MKTQKPIPKRKAPRMMYKCTRCESMHSQWYGKCPVCRAYASIQENIIKPVNVKPEKRINNYWGFFNQRELFNHIWRNSDKKCELSGLLLKNFYNTDKWYSCFAHVLNKGLYPLYKLNPDNIILLHPDVHTCIDQGTEEQRKLYESINNMSFKRFYEIRKILLIKYDRFKKDYS